VTLLPGELADGPLGFLFTRWAGRVDDEALVHQGTSTSYGELLGGIVHAYRALADAGVEPGTVVAVEADFSVAAVAALLAAAARRAVIVPLAPAVGSSRSSYLDIAEVGAVVTPGADGPRIDLLGRQASHPIHEELRRRRAPGLVLFSSGSTGAPKAAVHDLSGLLEKFRVVRRAWRTVAFLLFDHIGGINTMLATLANGGTLVVLDDRRPEAVAAAIDRHRVEVLPTSPSFLNLLLVGGAVDQHDLSSLQMITYGTEVMPEATLARLHALLPEVRLHQTYGLSELGILRSKSRADDSLWVSVGGEGYETRIVDGMLEIHAASAMLGYLNAPSPFTDDGWFRTGDAVEVDGEWLRFLGRRSELINVGGDKVWPAEVESVLATMDGVLDVSVHGEPNRLLGSAVAARVHLDTGEDRAAFRRRMRDHCRGRLADWKVPQRVEVVDGPLVTARFKRER
jgi:long-chain acyl-CoA synthetase